MKSLVALLGCLIAVAVAGDAIDASLIHAVNSNPHSTWKAGANKYFADASLEQVVARLGFVKNVEKASRRQYIHHDINTLALPAQYDASQAYPNCQTIGTIYDQAECGSCWAFGCVEAVQDRFCIQSSGKVNVPLSFQDLVSCGPDDGCEGGDDMDAWEYVSESGIVTASCQPYTVPTCPPETEPCLNFTTTPNCEQSCVDNEIYSKAKHFVEQPYGVGSDESQIRAELYKNGPVEACFDVYADFVNYKSGVYSHQTGDYLGGHCIKIIGWGTENGTPYWLCNNSWTTTWGDNGQFKILRGSDECGIEDDIVAGMASL